MYVLVSIWAVAIYAKCLAVAVSDVEGNTIAQNEGLYAFYNSLGGSFWTWADYDTPWVFEEGEIHDPCVEEWTGIVCNNTADVACQPSECMVTGIVLEGYNLTGQLPNSFDGLQSIQAIDVGFNSISGSIPSSLGDLIQLQSLSIGHNSLEGKFPACMNELSRLRVIDIIGNHVSGSIPEFSASIDTMFDLYLGENDLTGTIPDSVTQMTNMEYIYFTQNKLNGSIPEALGSNLKNLYYLGLSTNNLDGYLPHTVGSLQNLRYMMLNGNHMYGTIPRSIGDMTNLQFFEANFNDFSGPVPEVFGNCLNMYVIEICDNNMNGTLPSSLGKLKHMNTLYLDANYITGTIPSEYGQLKNLTGLLLYDNMLTGPIPSALGSLQKLEELSLYKNELSGLIPESITKMTSLIELVLQDNKFDGFECIHNYGYSDCEFDMPSLQRLDVSDNRLDGSVPAQIFHLPELRSVALVNGCFDGHLTDDICLATNLEVLSLDGLTSSPKCRKSTASPLGLQKGYIVRHYMSGSIPDCVWNMPNLTVLHMAGNGLSGTLPNSLPTDSKLVNVSVAYNKMSGELPNGLQVYPFIELCVAYNKLSGVMSSSLHHVKKMLQAAVDGYEGPAIGSVLSVEVNRLSGFTSPDLEKVGIMDALNGNFFNCDASHPLPDNDEQSSYYICGSKNLDQSLFVWAVVGSLILIFIGTVVLVRWNKKSETRGSDLTSAGMDTIIEDECEEYCSSPRYSESSALTQDLLGEPSLSLHTAPGSFDADCDRDSLFERSKKNQACKEYKYYGKSSIIVSVKYYYNTMKLSIFATVSTLISWFEESMKFTADSTSSSGSGANGGSGSDLKDLKVFVSLLCMIRRSAMLITGIIILICLPLYLLLKLVWGNDYSTHKHQYGWLVSSAFLAGFLPAIFILVIFLILCAVLAYSLVRLYPAAVVDASHYVRMSMLSFPRDSAHITLTLAGLSNNQDRSDNTSAISSPDNSLNTSSYLNMVRGSRSTLSNNEGLSKRPFFSKVGAKQTAAFISLFALNVAVTLSVNGLYVYGFDTSTHYYVKVSMKVVLALFQIAWNLIVVPKTIEYVARLVHDTSSRVKWLITLCLSFNYIIAPAMASILSSSTCFADYFKEQPHVVSFYQYDICRAYSLDVSTNTRYCTELSTASFSTSFVPPFMYYYQCSSTLVTSYVPILMLEHAILVVVPIVVALILSYEWAAKSAPLLVVRILPSIVWPPQYRPKLADSDSFSGAILRPDRMIAAFMSHFVVLITYGLADPFLAVAICCAMCTLTVLAQILIGRYLLYFRSKLALEGRNGAITTTGCAESVSETSKLEPLKILNLACIGILDGLPSCLWTILFIASVYMSCILADMASDDVSWTVGIFVGLPAFLGPLVAYGTLKYALYSSYA